MANVTIEKEWEIPIEIRGEKAKKSIRAFIGQTELIGFAEDEDLDALKTQIDFNKLPGMFEVRLTYKLHLLAKAVALSTMCNLEDLEILYGDQDITEALDEKTAYGIEDDLFMKYMDR